MAMASVGLVSKEGKQVPLKSVAVSGVIKGYLFGLETKLSYVNSSDDPLEVMFRFPVDESSAVVGLEAKINGRTIKGEVREKQEARQMYDDAVASGQVAALGEEMSGDIFSITLGNLPPKEEAEIILKLSGELSIDKEIEAARFSLPTSLKPRYTPADSQDPLALIGGVGVPVEKGSVPAVSSFSLLVDKADDVSSITSPTHTIKAGPNPDGLAEVTLTNSTHFNKDIVILVQYKYCHNPRAVVEYGMEGSEGNQLMSNPAVMLEFFPKFDSLQAACEFIFLVDRSGSMRGNYINSAKETLILFLKSIPPGCYFNIIGFGSRYEKLFPSSVPYNQTNLDKATKHAQGLSANLGGTELLPPLQYVFDEKLREGLPRQVFVLTDGSVSNTDACIQLTKRNTHSSRVFTFGIGSGASTALVKGLARAGNGSAEFIKEGERMQGKVISSLKKALQPSVSDLELKLSVPSGIEVLQAPNKIPPVFNGEKLVMYGWLKGGRGKSGQCTALLRGKMFGSDVEHRIDFNLEGAAGSSPSSMAIVHQLAAKSLIQDWEAEKDKPEKKAAIIKLSTESSVVSSLTSYIAIDEDQDKPIEGAIKTYDLSAVVETDLFGFGFSQSAGGITSGGGGGFYNSMMSYAPQMQCFGAPPPPMMGGGMDMLGGGMNMLGGPPPPPSGSMFAPPPPSMNMMGGGLPTLGSNSMHLGGSVQQSFNTPLSFGMAPQQMMSTSDSFGFSNYAAPQSNLQAPLLPPPPPANMSAPPPPPAHMSAPPPPPPTAYMSSSATDNLLDLDNSGNNSLFGNLSDPFSSSLNNRQQLNRSHAPVPRSERVMYELSPPSSSTDQLSRLVALQSAEGYWGLDESLASIIGRSVSDLKSCCPSGCSDVLWGTVLAMVLLETKYSSQKDEWELLAMKTSTWIQGQTLPPGAPTIDSLKQHAKQALVV